jgi:hypothetical protein
MIHHGRNSIFPLFFILVALTLALMFSCSEQPTAVDTKSGAGLDGDGTIDPGASGAFLLGEVSDTSLGPGTIEVWAMNVAFDETLGLVTFDAQIVNHTQSVLAARFEFVINSIVPKDIAVVDFDGITGSGFPYYVFSERLGGGDRLQPGDRTEPVTMKFHTVTARSFAISFFLAAGPSQAGAIGGVVFLDANGDGERDRECRCEEGIDGITVALELTLPGGDKTTRITRTDIFGGYSFKWLQEGVYKVSVCAPQNEWRVTSANPLLVTLVKGADGNVLSFLEANFGLLPLRPETTLFGPIATGLFFPFGTEIDSTFVNPPSPLTVIFTYYLEVEKPPASMPGVVDSAEAWINGEPVFRYAPPDSLFSGPRTIKIRDGLVKEGENAIRLRMDGDEWAALMWRVYKKP